MLLQILAIPISAASTRLDELQKELFRKANSKQDYDAIADEIFTLREQKSQAEADTRCREETRNRIAELQDFIAGQETDITEFDEIVSIIFRKFISCRRQFVVTRFLFVLLPDAVGPAPINVPCLGISLFPILMQPHGAAVRRPASMRFRHQGKPRSPLCAV